MAGGGEIRRNSPVETREVNAYQIQLALMRECFRRHLCCPNYTPSGWWECDVFEVTKAGCFYEYEIKLSVADFKADARKENRKWIDGYGEDAKYDVTNKHDLLSKGDSRGPQRFFFVVPKELADQIVIPAWAGLITVRYYESAKSRFKASIQTEKDAPRLHKQKVNPKVLEHVRGIFYYRFMEHYIYRGQPPEEPINDLEAPPQIDLQPEPELLPIQ